MENIIRHATLDYKEMKNAKKKDVKYFKIL